jgi:DeoR family transcriptional regulator, aga operon transcriptional repressor
MNKQDRLSRILELAVERSSLEVEEVAILLKVSPATVRRDFDALAKRQLLSRTHGGAVASGGSLALPLNYKVARGDAAKERIAQAAAELVTRYAIIGINGGTTTTAVARALVARPEFAPGEQSDSQPALTVVTNALNIAAELTVRHQIKIVVTGGVARPQSYELTGPFADEVLKEINIDIAFIGVDALDAVAGASADHEDEARVNRQVVSRARKVVVVADSSKFTKRAFATISPLSEIDVLITDDGISPETAKEFRALGVEVIVV